jgi:hypothetical protein
MVYYTCDINALHEHVLSSRSRTSEESLVSVRRVYFATTDSLLMWAVSFYRGL